MSQDNFILVAHTCSGVYHIERFVVEPGEARAVSRFKMSSAASMIVRQEMMLTKWFELISILIRSMRARICSTMSITCLQLIAIVIHSFSLTNLSDH